MSVNTDDIKKCIITSTVDAIDGIGVLQKMFVETAEIRYYEYQRTDQRNVGSVAPSKSRVTGSFTEKIEIDEEAGVYERLDIPPILESKRSTVVHDFEKVVKKLIETALFVQSCSY